MATMIDLEVQRLLSEGYQMAKAVLSEHYDQLDRLAHALLEHEQLDRAAFEQLVSALRDQGVDADAPLASIERSSKPT